MLFGQIPLVYSKIRYDAAKDTAARELMIYKKLGQKLFCNASVLSEIEAIGYSKKCVYILKEKMLIFLI